MCAVPFHMSAPPHCPLHLTPHTSAQWPGWASRNPNRVTSLLLSPWGLPCPGNKTPLLPQTLLCRRPRRLRATMPSARTTGPRASQGPGPLSSLAPGHLPEGPFLSPHGRHLLPLSHPSFSPSSGHSFSLHQTCVGACVRVCACVCTHASVRGPLPGARALQGRSPAACPLLCPRLGQGLTEDGRLSYAPGRLLVSLQSRRAGSEKRSHLPTGGPQSDPAHSRSSPQRRTGLWATAREGSNSLQSGEVLLWVRFP